MIYPQKDIKEPPIPREIVEYLMALYPDRSPDPDKDTDRQVWFNAGKAFVVTKLKSVYEEQNQLASE